MHCINLHYTTPVYTKTIIVRHIISLHLQFNSWQPWGDILSPLTHFNNTWVMHSNKLISHHPFANCPIIWGLLVNAMVGIVAKGSWRLIIALRMSFIPVRSSIWLKKARQKVGTIAIVLVNRTLFHLAHCRLRKPSIVNWPA